MDPITKGQEHFSRSAQLTLNMSLDFLKNLPQKEPVLVESCLRSAIACIPNIKREGSSTERSAAMTKQFDNTLRLMRKNGVEVTNSSMVSIFRNSLDDKSASVFEESLTPDNKALVENALAEVSSDKPVSKKSFESGGPSI